MHRDPGIVSSSWFYIIHVRFSLLRNITQGQSSTSNQETTHVLFRSEIKSHITLTMTIEAPKRTNKMPSQEKFEMMTSQGFSIQFYLVPPQKVEFSQQFCPTCCCLYRNNVGFRGSHQPIRLMCGHIYCLGCVLTRVDSIRDPMSACDQCHPDTNKPRSSSQAR